MNRTRTRQRRAGPAPRPEASSVDRLLAKRGVVFFSFLFLTVIYFSGFVFGDVVIEGVDTRNEFYLGKEPISQKLKDLTPENWSRYLGGTPMSGFRKGKYFPLHVVSLFTTWHRYLGWRYFFATFAAGFTMYLCARGIGLRRLPSWVTGLMYGFSPTLMTFIFPGQEGKMLVIGLLPLMVWALFRGMDTLRPIYPLILGATIAAGIFTPHLQMLYYALLGLGLLYLVRVVQTYLEDRDVRGLLLRSVVAASGVAFGLAVGAVGTFPAYHYTKTESRRAGTEGEGVGLDYAQSWSLHPEEIASLIVPEFVHFYRPDSRQNLYWGRNPLKLNTEYFGLVALVLSLVALARIRKDPRILPLVVLGAFALVFSLGPHTPLHALFYHFVPGMNVLRVPGMIAFLFAFPAILLAGITLDRFCHTLEEEDTKAMWVAGLVLGLPILLWATATETGLSLWRQVFWSDIPADRAALARANLDHLQNGAGLAVLWLGALLTLGTLRARNRIGSKSFLLLLVPIIFIDTWRVDQPYLKYIDPALHPDPEVRFPNTVGALRADDSHYRVLVSGRRLQIDKVDLVNVAYHEPFSVRRYDVVVRDHLSNLQMLNLLNTKYVVTDREIRAAGLVPVTTDRGAFLYRNQDALPFFYLAGKALVLTDEPAILAKLQEPGFDPAQAVILESDLPVPLSPSGEGRVNLLEFQERQGRMVFEVDTPTAQVLVISQNYFPYWSATVDGNPVDLFRANYLWQGVVIPPGRHRVELDYYDGLAVVCRWLSLISTVGLIAGLVYFGRREWCEQAA